jgi:hypothetical protein
MKEKLILTGLVCNSAEIIMSEIVGEGRPTNIILWQEESFTCEPCLFGSGRTTLV